MFDARPVKCPICGSHVSYGKLTDFGLEPYQSGYCYHCDSCGAYVGTHKNNPKDALGVLSTGNVRRLRAICHEEMEKHYYSSTGRNRAYYSLSKALNLKKDDCHFGHMNEEQLLKALKIMKGWEKMCFR